MEDNELENLNRNRCHHHHHHSRHRHTHHKRHHRHPGSSSSNSRSPSSEDDDNNGDVNVGRDGIVCSGDNDAPREGPLKEEAEVRQHQHQHELTPPPQLPQPSLQSQKEQSQPSFSALLEFKLSDYEAVVEQEKEDDQSNPQQQPNQQSQNQRIRSLSQGFTSPDLSVGSNFSPTRLFSKTDHVLNPPFSCGGSGSGDDHTFGTPPFEEIAPVEANEKADSCGNNNCHLNDPSSNQESEKESNKLLGETSINAAGKDSGHVYTTEGENTIESEAEQVKKAFYGKCRSIKEAVCPPSFSWVVGVFLLVSILLPLIVSIIITSNNSKNIMKDQFVSENDVVTTLFFSSIEKRVEMAENMVFEMSSLMSNQICDISTPEKTLKLLLSLLLSFGRGSTLQVAFPNGTSYLVMDHESEYSYWVSDANSTNLCQHFTDRTCSEDRGLGECIQNYVPANTEWYKNLNLSVSGEYKWSNLTCVAYVYYAFSVVTYVENDLFAVVTVTYITEDMRNLVQFPVENNIVYFIVDLKNEILVSSSISDVDVGYVNKTTGKAVVHRVSEVSNELILDADYHVKQRYGSWAAIRSESFLVGSMHKGDEEMVISSMRLDRNGLSWGIVAIKTASSSVLDTHTWVAIFLIVIAFAVFGLIVSELLLRPIKTLSKDMKLISRLNFQRKIYSNEVTPGYFIREKKSYETEDEHDDGGHTKSSGGGNGGNGGDDSDDDDDSSDDPNSNSSNNRTLTLKCFRSCSSCRCGKKCSSKTCCGGSGASNHWSPFYEVREMQESFSKFRAGAEALTKYVSPQVILDVMDKIAAHRKENRGRGRDRRESCELINDTDVHTAHVVVMYTDLENFTSLSEEIKRSLLVNTLNLWFKGFGEIIQANGGMIDKFIGDCIMALYGAPRPLKDNELAACKSALEFKKAFQRVNALLKLHKHPPIRYRVGIHSGEVLLGHIGYEDHVNYTVCGLSVEIANKMEQLGKTYHLTPLITGDVATESVLSEYLCVLLNVEKIDTRQKPIWIRVYHLVCHMDYASKKLKGIAACFEKIHSHIQHNEIPLAVADIKSAKRDKDFVRYRQALNVLYEYIKRGLIDSQSFYKSDHLIHPIVHKT